VPAVKDCGKLRVEVGTSEKNIAVLNNEIKDATGALKQRLKEQLKPVSGGCDEDVSHD